MPVNPESNPCIGVTELLFRDLRRCPGREQETRVHVPEGMEATARNLQLVEDRRKSLAHYVLPDEKMPAPVQEKPGRRKTSGTRANSR